VYIPPFAGRVGLQSLLSNVVEEHRCTDLFVPIRQLRVAVKTDSVLFRVIGDLIRLTVSRTEGVRARLLDIRRRTDSGDLRELACAKL